jgi:hypothetical protein
MRRSVVLPAPFGPSNPNTAMTGLGGGVGVVAGGLLTTYASWRWVFFVNAPIGLLLAFGARFAFRTARW